MLAIRFRSFMEAFTVTNKLIIKAAARPRELKTIINRSPDLHAFPRMLAIKKVFRAGVPTVEAGAADGWFSFELAPYFKTPIKALAYTDNEFEAMKNNIRVLGLAGTVYAGKDDAQTLNSIKDGSQGQVLLVDVLEHVEDDGAAIRSANRVLKTGGRFVISVPTPYYPYWFGERFDKIIGHQRHFTKECLASKLEEQGFEISDYFYYTTSASSKLMKLWYRNLKVWPKEYEDQAGGLKIGMLSSLILPILGVLSVKLDSYDNELKGHSSLCMVAIKISDVVR